MDTPSTYATASPIQTGASFALLPLRAQDRQHRSQIVGAALVDYDTYLWAAEYRWHANDQGYVVRGIYDPATQKTRYVRLHREIMGLEVGDPLEVDHIDREPLNNLRSNLRACTHAQNLQNRRVEGNRGSTSRYRGVSWVTSKKRWRAQATIASKVHHIGYFVDEEKAAEAAAKFREARMTHSTN